MFHRCATFYCTISILKKINFYLLPNFDEEEGFSILPNKKYIYIYIYMYVLRVGVWGFFV